MTVAFRHALKHLAQNPQPLHFNREGVIMVGGRTIQAFDELHLSTTHWNIAEAQGLRQSLPVSVKVYVCIEKAQHPECSDCKHKDLMPKEI